jgi:hypothetical protein
MKNLVGYFNAKMERILSKRQVGKRIYIRIIIIVVLE